jgi:hypothetical protein
LSVPRNSALENQFLPLAYNLSRVETSKQHSSHDRVPQELFWMLNFCCTSLLRPMLPHASGAQKPLQRSPHRAPNESQIRPPLSIFRKILAQAKASFLKLFGKEWSQIRIIATVRCSSRSVTLVSKHTNAKLLAIAFFQCRNSPNKITDS